MKMIIGLGNNDKEYKGTRHNVGYNVLDYITRGESWAALYELDRPNDTACYISASENEIYIKPVSGNMNNSGIPSAFIQQLFEISNNDIIVVYDDITLDVGEINVRANAGHGKSGHNGLASLIKHLGNNFIRVRVGIGKPKDNKNIIDYVLEEFKEDEIRIMNSAYHEASIAIISILTEGVNGAMNKFNHEKETNNNV